MSSHHLNLSIKFWIILFLTDVSCNDIDNISAQSEWRQTAKAFCWASASNGHKRCKSHSNNTRKNTISQSLYQRDTSNVSSCVRQWSESSIRYGYFWLQCSQRRKCDVWRWCSYGLWRSHFLNICRLMLSSLTTCCQIQKNISLNLRNLCLNAGSRVMKTIKRICIAMWVCHLAMEGERA